MKSFTRPTPIEVSPSPKSTNSTRSGSSSVSPTPKSFRSNYSSAMATPTSTRKFDPSSQRKQQLMQFAKYLSSLFPNLDVVDEDEYILELRDAIAKVSTPNGPASLSSDESFLADYYRDIEGHDPVKLNNHMEDIAAMILYNPSAAERDAKRDRLINGFTNLKTAIERKDVAQNLDADTLSDTAKYQSLCKLFDINYFSSNTFYELASSNTETRLSLTSKRVAELRSKERKELHDQRQKELSRARTAKLFFDSTRQSTGNPSAPRMSTNDSPSPSIRMSCRV